MHPDDWKTRGVYRKINGRNLFPEVHRALLTQKLLLSRFGWLFNRVSNKRRFDSAFS